MIGNAIIPRLVIAIVLCLVLYLNIPYMQTLSLTVWWWIFLFFVVVSFAPQLVFQGGRTLAQGAFFTLGLLGVFGISLIILHLFVINLFEDHYYVSSIVLFSSFLILIPAFFAEKLLGPLKDAVYLSRASISIFLFAIYVLGWELYYLIDQVQYDARSLDSVEKWCRQTLGIFQDRQGNQCAAQMGFNQKLNFGLEAFWSKSYETIDWLLVFSAFVTLFISGGLMYFVHRLPFIDWNKKDTDSVHGSARHATKKEIRKRLSNGTLLLGEYDGQPISLTPSASFMTYAGTNSGKSRSMIVPNALSYPHQIILFDPKGELHRIVAEYRKKMFGRDYVIIDSMDASLERSNDFLDVFTNILIDEDGAWTLCQSYAKALHDSSRGENVGNEQFFMNATTTLIGYILFTSIFHPDYRDFPSLERVKDISDGIKDGDSLVDYVERCVSLAKEKKFRTNNYAVLGQGNNLLQAIERGGRSPTYDGWKQGTDQALRFLMDRPLRRIFNNPEGQKVSLTEIEQGDLDVYINVSSDQMENYPSAIRLIITAIYATFSRRRANSARKPKTVVFVDEFPAFGHLSIFKRIFSQGRTYDIVLWVFSQSVAQLKTIWRDEGIAEFESNSDMVQYFGVRDPITATRLRESLGTRTAKVATSTTGRNAGMPVQGTRGNMAVTGGVNTGAVKTDLMSANEIKYLNEDNERGVKAWGRRLLGRGGGRQSVIEFHLNDDPIRPVVADLKIYWDYPEWAHLAKFDNRS